MKKNEQHFIVFVSLGMIPVWYTLAYSNHFIMVQDNILYTRHHIRQNDLAAEISMYKKRKLYILANYCISKITFDCYTSPL